MIKLTDVSRTFESKNGKVKALDRVSLEVKQGSVYGIIGYSGAGKSTLLRLVNGLEHPDHGQVTVDGQDLSTLNPKELIALRRRTGMVFQQFNLLESKSVFHNTALPLILAGPPKGEIEEKVRKVLSFVGLPDKAQTPVSRLSGGQKQRVGIARALVTDPKVLLCDEATSALDPQTTVAILELLKRVNRELGVTILLITHQMSVISMICDEVAVMEAGRIVEQGSVLQVFSTPKADITRSFVKSVVNDSIPQSILAIVRGETEHFKVERLRFVGDSVKKPVIAALCQTPGVTVNILCATVTEVQESVICIYIVQLIGTEERIAAAERQIDASEIIREYVEIN